MIRHIVLLKMHDSGTPEEKIKATEAVRNELLSLKNKIPFIEEYEVGINISNDNAAYDLAINSAFASKEDLKSYIIHPDHQAFILFNKKYSEKKVVVDYEY